MKPIDVAIVGAGAAGVAAGRHLAASGLDVLLIEATDRIGGRAHTAFHDGLHFDLGCGWLHSADRNGWASLAPQLGFHLDRTTPPWGVQFRDLGFPAADQRAARAAFARFEQRLREAPPGSDRASDLLDASDRWTPYLEALSTYINGTELEQLSIRDYLAYADAETGVNWRVTEGYGSLVAAAAQDVPVALSTAITGIDASGHTLRLTSVRGEIVAARVIVTVPTDVLASGAIRLPPRASDHIDAAGALPLGLADKIIFKLSDCEGFEPDTQLLGNPSLKRTASYHLRPFGRPLIEGFVGGEAAREFEADGDAFAAFARDELAGLFGSGIRSRLEPIAQTRWGRQPFARGSYSHALPGHAEARAILASDVDGRLFFAGEACSTQDFSTAHGALQTGFDAARAVLNSLKT
ncbi:flavin monoamine oxidase family protein [Bosea psychrotolerans]|uniref:Tryptophan 2-monooxygenase n=1 Tax=Bosea psychrotolerans TaxID=1871628 RepID=A0A2S4MQD4_9HYPH|nr:NAD(P)/FAD-dependent oxidoreductase [Bosea psychrotolerans]POR56855.1 monoamine oxidase [Bosea psychrotolerans]